MAGRQFRALNAPAPGSTARWYFGVSTESLHECARGSTRYTSPVGARVPRSADRIVGVEDFVPRYATCDFLDSCALTPTPDSQIPATVHAYVNAGAAGLHMEDQVFQALWPPRWKNCSGDFATTDSGVLKWQNQVPLVFAPTPAAPREGDATVSTVDMPTLGTMLFPEAADRGGFDSSGLRNTRRACGTGVKSSR